MLLLLLLPILSYDDKHHVTKMHFNYGAKYTSEFVKLGQSDLHTGV